MLFDLLPTDLTLFELLVLVFSSCLTSMLTAAVGIGGGVLLLAIMAQMIPIAALIPVHGLVQLGSNGSRAVMTRKHIDWSLINAFFLGALLGAVVASFIVIQLPLHWIQLAVALFILYLVWGPKPEQHQMTNKGIIAAGGFTTLISMFVGATGPLVASFVHRQSYDKLSTTATFAACMSFQHLLKLFVFSVAGFVFWQWLPVVVLMVLAGTVGTWLGLKMLNRIPTQHFKTIFRAVITLLALRLLWQGVWHLI